MLLFSVLSLSIDTQGLLAHLENVLLQSGELSPQDEERLEDVMERVPL